MSGKKSTMQNFVQIVALGVLIFVWADFVSAQKNNVENAALVKFETSIEAGNFAAIERDLLNYAIANPQNARAFELLGKLRFAQNRLNEAVSLFQKALTLDPNLTAVRINLAVINFQKGDAESAVANLTKIAESDVTNERIRLSLAQTFALVGDCQTAQVHIEKLSVKIKNGDALPIRADCFLRSGEREKAISLIVAAKKAAKQNPATAIKFAEIISSGGLFRESADVLRSVIAIAPGNADALISLARAEIYDRDLDNAKIHLDRAAKANPNAPDLLLVKSLLESEQGNAAQALETLEKSLAANPDSAIILSRFVVAAMRANQAGTALRAAEKLLELKPNEPEFLYLHGATALQGNNLKLAETSLKRYAELRPNDSRGCLALGLAYAAQPDKLENARQQFRKCIEANPKNFEAKYQLGLSYKTQGETAKAVEYLEATVNDAPEYALALRDLGAVYLQSGAESKARVVLEKSAAINQNDADTHFQLSRLYNLTGEIELAQKHLKIFQKLKNPSKSGM